MKRGVQSQVQDCRGPGHDSRHCIRDKWRQGSYHSVSPGWKRKQISVHHGVGKTRRVRPWQVCKHQARLGQLQRERKPFSQQTPSGLQHPPTTKKQDHINSCEVPTERRGLKNGRGRGELGGCQRKQKYTQD